MGEWVRVGGNNHVDGVNGRSKMDERSLKDHVWLSEAEQILLARRAELAQRVGRTEVDLHHVHEPLVADFADQATQRANEDVLREIGASARDQLSQVNRALERLAKGEYPYCIRCGVEIGHDRLRAIPEADSCARCAATDRS